MLALKGDTAPYVQYSYARVYGIFRKGDFEPNTQDVSATKLMLENPAERSLAIKLLRFEEALSDILTEYKPNLLTGYLFELSQLFASFFEQCPVIESRNRGIETKPIFALRFNSKSDQARFVAAWNSSSTKDVRLQFVQGNI